VIGRTVAHYEVLGKLGEGGMGAVYKARDRRLDRSVALKVVSAGRTADQGRRRRFIQEAKAASALNHPNIITIYEIAEWEGRDYIAMEFIDGRTLRALVRPPSEPSALLPILRQLTEALAVAHAAGIVHRDIKPDNVMLRADGYVKVLDFGLARLTRGEDTLDDTATRPGALLGTARYMSPEQARGESADSPSDVFSLGIVFYELLTGSHPFAAGTPTATLSAILSDAPPPLTRLRPEVPGALEHLVLRMLSKEAVLRPTAAEVLGTLSSLGPAGPAVSLPRAAAARRSCVGRERELQELQSAFEGSSAGGLTLLCVTGEPGLGKTTIVEEFLDGLRERRGTAWVARGRCSERLAGTDALLPILEGLDSLVRGESGDQAARLLKRIAPTWYLQIAPSMGDSTAEALSQESRTASQERMKRELHSALEELARIRPVVLFFDDMHWSDLSTCDLLSYLGARCRDLPVLLVVTYRPTELHGSKHPFMQVRLAMQGRGACRDLPVGFLTRRDVERLVALTFPEHRFPPELVHVVHARTEGNPLFLSDVLRYLRDRGVLAQEDGAWVLTQPASEIEKDTPESLRSMVQLKIGQLGDDDRRLLIAAAVQGVQFDSAVVAKALGRDPADVEERLQELEKAHDFVRATAEGEFPDRTLTVRYRFVHALYQNGLYAMLTPSRRASLSATVAEAILAFSGDKAKAHAADLAFLFESARDFKRAAPFFLHAARAAARVFAYPEARILAEKGLRAVETLPDSDERAKLELPLSVALGISLMALRGYADPAVGRTHLRSRELCQRLGDERRLFPVLWGLCVYYLIAGQLKKALEVADQMLGPAEASGQPAVLILALHAKGTTLGYMGRLKEARVHLERILTLYDPSQHPFYAAMYVLDPSVTTHCMLARFLVVMGRLDEALRYVQEAADRARALVHPQSVAYATFYVAWIRHDRGEVDEAAAEVERAMELCTEHGLSQIIEWARLVRGWALCARGRLREGTDEVRRSLAAQRAMHSELERPYCLAILARGLAGQGEFEEALECVAEALAIVQKSDERSYEAEIYRLGGEVLLARAVERADTAVVERTGDALGGGESPSAADALLAEAEAAFEKAITLAREAGAKTLELRALSSLFHLRERTGDPAPVREDLASLLASFTEGLDTPPLVEARRLLAH
jgi:tetratricopeptide (TPR) repeat protein/tRNA A-37 threonylcarbamoyl transferase component Bud32